MRPAVFSAMPGRGCGYSGESASGRALILDRLLIRSMVGTDAGDNRLDAVSGLNRNGRRE